MAYTSKHGVDDMVMLSKLSNDAINDNLKKRYQADIIYTYIGHVLISVNPFKEIKGLYTDRTLKDYRGKYRYELPPHVYSLADEMYRSMLTDRENQCVIISGESGAGKTEASKKIMQFIAAIAGSNPNVVRVKDAILQSNPLLEAFGNAKTLRNNNSSRFGKYMEIQFDLSGDPEGGRINNYLLEKSRVVYRTPGERAFHVFYQLLIGADGNMKSELGLTSPENYLYLSSSNCYDVEFMDDREEWGEMRNAMNVMGITADWQMEIFRLLSGILYIGNITFQPDGKDYAQVRDKQVTDMVAYLLQTDAGALIKSIVSRTISTGTQGRSARVSTYACPQNVPGAEYSRDALAKALYSRLFDWIIARVNEALGWVNDNDCLTLGILDIYGFEIFEKNGFEQFCINYVNEKLQQIFIQLTLKSEQDEYAAEGIPWEHIDFFNNKICCDLIELKKPVGLLALLDDTCNFPKGDDVKFLQKVNEVHGQHPHCQPHLGTNEFTIRHYAGDVTYHIDGFCDKNRDTLFNDLIDLANCTSSALISSLFPEAKTAPDKRRPTTAGFKIKESINQLVDTLSRCTPHYIRCIKPNDRKRNDYDSNLSLHQVKYLGLLENVRVRRAGYAYRQTYEKFFYRYRVCSTQTWPNWGGDFVSAAEVILGVLNLEPGGFAKGKTKVFIRAPESVFALEELRERKVYTYANQIQSFFLRFSMSNYFYNLQVSGNQRLQGHKERRRNSIERPFKTDYIGYRENFGLKAIVEANGREKLVFGDRINKYDRRLKPQRRILLLTGVALYIVAIEKNKDKDKVARAKKPWLYVLKRRLELNRIRSIVFSPYADNFLLLCIPDEYDSLVETRRKTEFIANFVKFNSSVSISFSANMDMLVKGGKNRVPIQFLQDPLGGDGKVKGKRVIVAPGLSKDTVPNIQPPVQAQTFAVQSDPYGNLRSAGGPPRGRGGARGGGRQPPSAPASAQFSAPSVEQCKALYDFDAENPDELTFKTGDVIEIIEKQGEWWKGSFNGQVGIFPANYVEVIESARPPPSRGMPAPTRGPPRGAPGPGRAPSRGMPAPGPGRAPSRGMPAPNRGPPSPAMSQDDGSSSLGPAPGRGPVMRGAPAPGRAAPRGMPRGAPVRGPPGGMRGAPRGPPPMRAQ